MKLKTVGIFLCSVLKIASIETTNKVCDNYQDYSNVEFNKNCRYNPDMFSTPPNVAYNHGFEFQNHVVETEDGYQLAVFRIQDNFSEKRKQPVLIHHGLVSSAMGFMVPGNRSLAFYLAKNGYDVWLGNHRGNTYSSGHSYLNTSNQKFWDFSFHEIGFYDLPAVLEYISIVSGGFSKIVYVGHSMGCTACLVYASLKSDHAERFLKGFIALAPTSSRRYISKRFELLAPINSGLLQGLIRAQTGAFIQDPEIFSKRLVPFCQKHAQTCVAFLNSAFGKDDSQITAEDFMLFLSYHPARTSLKCFAHINQLIIAKKFQPYDYGPRENLKRYNSATPPSYPLENIKIPVHIFYGQNDNLASPQDALWLFNTLETNEKSIRRVPHDGKVKFNHINFIVAKDIELYLYQPLIRILKQLEST